MDASGTPPCIRANFTAISPGFSCDPDTTAARESSIRCRAANAAAAGNARSRAAAIYRANSPVKSPLLIKTCPVAG